MNTTTLRGFACAGTLMMISLPAAAATLTYTDVNANGIMDTVVAGTPARLIHVTDDDLVLQAGDSITLQLSFSPGQGLQVAPSANPQGSELINLALVSPAVNGTPPSASLAGTVSALTLGDFLPASGQAAPFVTNFTPNSPLAGSDTILLIRAGNLTDAGYTLLGLEYQLTVPAGFTDYSLTGINLLVTGGAFSVVPLPAGFPLLLSALAGLFTLRRARETVRPA